MEITFETLNMVKELIAAGDTKKITELLKEINGLKDLWYSIGNYSRSESLIRLMFMSFRKLLFTNPELYDDDEFAENVSKLMPKIYGEFFMLNSDLQNAFYFDNLLEMIENRSPQRLKSINAFMKLLKDYIEPTYIYIMSNIINVIFLYKDYELADGIADELNNQESYICKIATAMKKKYRCYNWELRFIGRLIENKLYDTLDKVVRALHIDNEFINIKIDNFSLGMPWIEIVSFLYKRYTPDITDKELGEKIIGEHKFWALPSMNCSFGFPTEELSKEDIIGLIKSGARISNINQLVKYFRYFLPCEVSDTLVDLIADDAVFYLNDSMRYGWSECDKIKIILDAKPGAKICIGDNPYQSALSDGTGNGLIFDNRQIKSLLKGREISLTEPIKECKCISHLVKIKDKAIVTILDKLEPNAQACSELAELCVKHKNFDLLKEITEKYCPKKAAAS